MRKAPVLVMLLACLAAVLGVTWTPGAGAAAPSVPVGAPPVLPPGAVLQGAADPSTPLHLTIALRPPDPAGLAAYATAVSTPGNPLYGHYLTTAQFAGRFGAPDAVLDEVRAALRTQGLTPGPAAPNRLAIPVSTTAGRALGAGLRTVRLRNGRQAYLNTAAPHLPASVAARVQAVIGLDDLSRATPAANPKASGPQACPNAATQPGYTPAQLAQAYGLSGLYGAGDFGAGQTIAVFELADFNPSDVAAYQACFGTATGISSIPVDGGPTPGTPATVEDALDIEGLIGLAPQASLRVYIGPNTPGGIFDTYQAIVDDPSLAGIVSTSWGQCEQETGADQAAAESTLFQQAAVQGQSVLSAAGDNGSKDCVDVPFQNSLAVDDPASQPFVTGVGGTDLEFSPSQTETVWSDSDGATGGGVSGFWPMPSYQAGLGVANAESSGVPCGAPAGTLCREVPDVASSAAPVHGFIVFYQGTWQVVGGTSIGPPLWAAAIAVANQRCGSAFGFLNPALYQAASAGPGAFHDVVTGDNNIQNPAGRYHAGAGYDMASGLGSPILGALVTRLCVPPAFTADSPPAAAVVGTPYGYLFTASGPRSHFGVSGGTLPPGLALSAIGVLAGTPSAAGVFSFQVTAANSQGSATSPVLTISVTRPPIPQVVGYWEVASDGGLFAFGGAPFLGSTGGSHLNQPVVGMVPTPDGQGYWEVASDGGLFAFGDAHFFGSTGGSHLNQPVVGMVATPDGGGYWEVASDGGLFAFGDAHFFGSTGGSHLNQPVVGMVPTPDGQGYWEVASDGGLFAFGDAHFFGSTGGSHLNQPVVGMVATPDGGGYWEVASDGGLFAFGDAHFFGSTGGSHLNAAVVGMAGTPTGRGYWEVASDGGLFAFGDAGFFGSTGGSRLNQPVVGIAVATR